MSPVSTKQYPIDYNFVKSSIENKTIDEYGMAGMIGINANNLLLLNKNNNIFNQPLPNTNNNTNNTNNSKYIYTNNIIINNITINNNNNNNNKTNNSLSNAPPLGRLLESNINEDTLNYSIFDTIQLQIPKQLQKQLQIYQASFDLQSTDIIYNALHSPILLSTYTYVPKPLQATIDNKLCINQQKCQEYNGKLYILKNQNRPSCVICPINKQYNEEKQQCQCIGATISDNNGECIKHEQFCGQDGNSVFENGACYDLRKSKSVCNVTKNEVFSEELKRCVCDARSVKTRNGNCLKCSIFAKVNEEKNACECVEGFGGNGKICRKIETVVDERDPKKDENKDIKKDENKDANEEINKDANEEINKDGSKSQNQKGNSKGNSNGKHNYNASTIVTQISQKNVIITNQNTILQQSAINKGTNPGSNVKNIGENLSKNL